MGKLFNRLLVLAVASAGILVTPPAQAEVLKDLAYGTLPLQNLDLFLPAKSEANTPLLVFVHGGAWVSGDKNMYSYIGENMSKLGVPTAVINYRLAGNGINKHPDQANDVAAALEWLRTNAAKYHFDTQQFYVAGHSAGGHLTAFLAPNLDWVRGFIGIAGIYDIPSFMKRFPDYVAVNKTFGNDVKGWHDASPTFLPTHKGARWLIVHSDQDVIVNLQQEEDFMSHVKKGGGTTRMVRMKWVLHAALVEHIGTRGDVVTEGILKFMKDGKTK